MSDDSTKTGGKENVKVTPTDESIIKELLVGSIELPMPYPTSATGIGVLMTGKTRPKTRDRS